MQWVLGFVFYQVLLFKTIITVEYLKIKLFEIFNIYRCLS